MIATVTGARHDQDANTRVEFFTMARRVLAHLNQQGASLVALASALMEMIWGRGDHDYLMESEEYFARLDLPVDVNRERADDLGAQAHAALIWLEAELWQEFIDYLEGMVGETEQVREARGRATMSMGECDRWWQWAAAHAPALPPRSGSRSRSRSRGEDLDTASLMEAGRGRPTPRQKPYPKRAGHGRGDDGQDPHDRGERRDLARDGEEHRRRQPRSRSQRVAARSAASSGAGAAITRETRRLEPRSTRAPPMTVADATCFWLHTMGLRDGPDVDDRRALEPSGHTDRVRALQEVRPEDVVVVMTGLLRTMAMLMVELSQLMMILVQPLLPGGDEEEVEVELDDEEVWMQTSMLPKKRSRDEVATLADDQHECRAEVAREQDVRVAQQEERAKEEDEQARHDECLYEQHLAAQYRDWEWWVVDNSPPPVPRRLRMVLTVTHGSVSEAVSCSVPFGTRAPGGATDRLG